MLKTTTKAMILGWGMAWFNPEAITNIFSYSEMAKKHRITYNSSKEDTFTVHLPGKQVKFTKTDQGLYAYKPPIKKRQNKVTLVNTIKGNKSFFTHKQYKTAKKARELYHALNTSSTKHFKNMITMNAIANNPVTTEDIKLAEQILGQDIGSPKGKTTRCKPLPIAQDYIEIPTKLTTKQKDVVLCIDGVKVNGLMFLTTVSKNICYKTSQVVIDKSVSSSEQLYTKFSRYTTKLDFTSKKSDVTTSSDLFKILYAQAN